MVFISIFFGMKLSKFSKCLVLLLRYENKQNVPNAWLRCWDVLLPAVTSASWKLWRTESDRKMCGGRNKRCHQGPGGRRGSGGGGGGARRTGRGVTTTSGGAPGMGTPRTRLLLPPVTSRTVQRWKKNYYASSEVKENYLWNEFAF